MYGKCLDRPLDPLWQAMWTKKANGGEEDGPPGIMKAKNVFMIENLCCWYQRLISARERARTVPGCLAVPVKMGKKMLRSSGIMVKLGKDPVRNPAAAVRMELAVLFWTGASGGLV